MGHVMIFKSYGLELSVVCAIAGKDIECFGLRRRRPDGASLRFVVAPRSRFRLVAFPPLPLRLGPNNHAAVMQRGAATNCTGRGRSEYRAVCTSEISSIFYIPARLLHSVRRAARLSRSTRRECSTTSAESSTRAREKSPTTAERTASR